MLIKKERMLKMKEDLIRLSKSGKEINRKIVFFAICSLIALIIIFIEFEGEKPKTLKIYSSNYTVIEMEEVNGDESKTSEKDQMVHK